MVGHAQVLDISPQGIITVYNGPAVYNGQSAVPLATSARARPAVVTHLGSILTDAAARYGLDPALLKAVAWKESRYRHDAVSPKGAVGVMQLMPGTARALGVDPRDLASNVHGGAAYLRRMMDRYGGNVALALAAYNAGPGAVDRYGAVPPYAETRGYVRTITGSAARNLAAHR